jgi:hypothetical protein
MADLAELLQRYGYGPQDPGPDETFDTRNVLDTMQKRAPNLLNRLAGAIPENTEHSVSLANMLKGGLDTAGRWLGGNPEVGRDTLAPLGLAGVGAALGPRNALGIFGGRLAKTADHAALAKAEQMAASGSPREAIWSETGWYQGPDKQWRFEIPDERSYAKEATKPDGSRLSVGRLPDFIGHRDLYKAYPKAQDTQVVTGGPPGGSFSGNWADYRPGEGALLRLGDMGGTLDQRRIALHEIQHGVQREEGFAPGWNPEDAAMPAMQAITQRMNQIARDLDQYRIPGSDKFKDPRGQQLYDEYMRLMSERSKVSGKDLYHRTSGEVEARNVMKRADMTPEERRALPPWATEDVPWDQQIVRSK